MSSRRPWCRVTVVTASGRPFWRHVVDGPGEPGLDAVDRIARLDVAARRCRCTLEVDDVVPALRELLDLAGLDVGA